MFSDIVKKHHPKTVQVIFLFLVMKSFLWIIPFGILACLLQLAYISQVDDATKSSWRRYIHHYTSSLASLSMQLAEFMDENFTFSWQILQTISSRDWFLCKYRECCIDSWTRHNITGLENGLSENLYGQPIAKNIVYKAVKLHLDNADPDKPLVLVFDGWSGSGKNFLSDLIAQHLYKNTDSKYVHRWIAGKDFPHQDKVHEYHGIIRETLLKNTNICGHSLFIVDEMDKLPVNVVDAFKPFLDHHRKIEGINFRRNIFIFLSNVAGEVINKEMRLHLQNGGSRDDVNATHLETLLKTTIFNVANGLKDSAIIRHNLVDFFVPFLPLEREHVIKCALAEMRRRNKTENLSIANLAADQLTYSGGFSNTGCKLIAKKLDLFL